MSLIHELVRNDFRERFSVSLDHPSLTDEDRTFKFFKASSALTIVRGAYINPTGLAQDPDNFYSYGVSISGVPFGGMFSSATYPFGLPAGFWLDSDMSPTPIAFPTLSVGDTVEMIWTHGTDSTVTLPPGRFFIEGYYL